MQFFSNGLCHKEMHYCPHCGLRRFIEFVHRGDAVRLLACYQYGLKVSRASNDLYVGMAHLHEACGARVWTRKDGRIEFGGFSSEVSDADATDIIKRLITDGRYDGQRCYLSRWDKVSRKLEVLHGAVPEDMVSRAPDAGLLTDIGQQLLNLAMMCEATYPRRFGI